MMPAVRVLFSEMSLKMGALNSGKGMRYGGGASPDAERFRTDVPRNQSMILNLDFNAVTKKCGMNAWNVVSGGIVAFLKLPLSLYLALPGPRQPKRPQITDYSLFLNS